MTNPMPQRTDRPALALGCMNFGKRTPAAEAERIVRHALERGIRVFDTANAYTGGESERILGRALGRERDRVVVATKVGFGRVAGKPEGLAPETLVRELEGSLDRLGTDRVDVYYLHVPDPRTPIERTLDAMKTLVDGGRVGAWGVSNYAAWQIHEMNGLAAARGLARPVVSQVLYNVLHRELDVEYFAFARQHPLHTTVFNPLAGGLLTGKHRFEEPAPRGSRFDDNALYRRRYWSRTMFARVEQLRGVAETEGLSLLQLAYAWLASRPGVDSVLVGPGSVAHLDDALDAIARTLSADAIRRVDGLSREWAGGDTHYVR